MSRLHTALQQRWQAWWGARHPASDTATCTQRNVYIVPTGAGWLFGALLLVLLLASINYQLNLGYLLTFLLAGVGLTSMHGTHATLSGLTLQLHIGEPVFLGETQAVNLRLINSSTRPRHGIGLRWLPSGQAPTPWIWIDVPAGAEHTAHLPLAPTRRGAAPLPRLQLETRFPFGLFRAWSYLRPASSSFAWPAPEQPAPPLPTSLTEATVTAAPTLNSPSGTDTSGVRPYRRGDPLQHIAWKKSAQSLAGGGELVSRERSGSPRSDCHLHWHDTAGLATEQRLARLCAWVLAAERSGQPYALALPSHTLDAGHGAAQRRACLDLLGSWPA